MKPGFVEIHVGDGTVMPDEGAHGKSAQCDGPNDTAHHLEQSRPRLEGDRFGKNGPVARDRDLGWLRVLVGGKHLEPRNRPRKGACGQKKNGKKKNSNDRASAVALSTYNAIHVAYGFLYVLFRTLEVASLSRLLS